MYDPEKAERSLILSLLLIPCLSWAQSTATPDCSCPDTAKAVLMVDSSRSQADILVRKAGFLKRFGHDHIIQAKQIEGYVYWPDDVQDACGALTFEVASLVVDDAAARERYQLDTNPSAGDIAKTTENMLSKVLESDRWPNVRILLTYSGGEIPDLEVSASIELHGMTREIVVPVLIAYEATGLSFSGEMEVTGSDFGMEPFSAIGGGLKIEDKLQIEFSIVLNY